jgi:hypothetical protein
MKPGPTLYKANLKKNMKPNLSLINYRGMKLKKNLIKKKKIENKQQSK